MTERRFAVDGDVDLSVIEELRSKLLVLVNATNDDLVLDCTNLQFIDSTGINVFMRTQRLLDVDGRRLRVENLNGMARRAFDILGLTEVLEGETEPA